MDNLEFSEPGEEFTGVRINPRDCLDHLLLIWVIEYLPHKPTQFSRPDKPSDVIVVDVVDLDEKDPETDEVGLMARHVWWRQAKLIQSLRPRVGSANPLLARMGKGGASQGYNAPFVLNSESKNPAAQKRALDWYSRNPSFQPSAPFVSDEDFVADPTPGTTQAAEPVDRNETLLERMARQAQEGARRLPPPPAGQGKIPF